MTAARATEITTTRQDSVMPSELTRLYRALLLLYDRSGGFKC